MILNESSKDVAPHAFTLDGVEYEYRLGKYFKKVKTLREAVMFGEIGLTKGCKRTATVKTEAASEFAIHNKRHYSSILKIDEELEAKRVNFLRNLQCFAGLSRRKVMKFMAVMERQYFTRG